MSEASDIEWLFDRFGRRGASWNLIRGCTRKSPGCGGPGPHGGCYAEVMAGRFSNFGNWGHGYATRTKAGFRWTGEIGFVPEMLDLPRRWKRARRIFVNSTSDWAHDKVERPWQQQMCEVMREVDRHTYLLLTKRPENMPAILDSLVGIEPMRHVWLGCSVENQHYATERLPFMREVAARGWNTWVSYEPALGPVSWTGWEFLKWLVCGGESGPRSRPFYLYWYNDTAGWCARHGIPFFGKQLGARPFYADDTPMKLKSAKGGDIAEWPEPMRIRQCPADMVP